MKLNWLAAIRWVLTLALIYGSYTETGILTAMSLFMIFVGIELTSIALSAHTAAIANLLIIIQARKKKEEGA